MELSRAIFLIAIWVIQVVALLIGFKQWKSPLWFLIAAGLLSDVVTSFLRRVLHYPNFQVVGNLYAIVEFVLISLLYRKVVFRTSWHFFTAVALAVTIFVYHTVIGSIWKHNATGASFFLLAFIAYSIIGFYKIIQKQRHVFLEKSRHFWVNVATLMFGSGSYFLFLFNDYLKLHDSQLHKQLWSIFFLSLNLFINLLYAVAITKKEDAGEWSSTTW